MCSFALRRRGVPSACKRREKVVALAFSNAKMEGGTGAGGRADAGSLSSDPAYEEPVSRDPAYEERDEEGALRYLEPARGA